jgi:hypothetical protein
MMLYHTIVGVHAGVEWIANREGSRPGGATEMTRCEQSDG